MLSVFPGLLYPFFAPLILRVVVGVLFVCIGIKTWRRAASLAAVKLPLIGAQAWMPYLAGLCELVLGLMFIFGWYTQIAALLGIVGALKYTAYRRWWPDVQTNYLPLSPMAMFLIAVICLSLLISGAGALAQDLPL